MPHSHPMVAGWPIRRMKQAARGIYVRPFPNVDDGKVTISVETTRAREPLWGPDGQEFFYKDVNAGTLMAVSVETDTTFRASAPELLFDVPAGPGGGVQYDVAPDGQRFLFILSTDDGSAAPQINVVLDWFQETHRARAGPCVQTR